LWFLNQLEPSNPCYNIPIALTLTGKLNIAVLEQSINEILRRHEALRSIFPTLDGKPVQVIAPVLTLNVPVVELGELPEFERETKADLLAIEEALKPFDLASDPLLRITLLRLSESKHVLLVTMHQIVCDAWSVSVFFRELEALYQVFSSGTPDSLPELPIQYKDFVDWQQQWLGSEDYQTQLAYWKQQLAGTLPVLELPTDRPRSPAQTVRGARQSLELPVTLTESLKALSQQEGVTLFMTLLAAFKVLLYRYTGEEDIIVGSPTPGRNCLESDALIGLFANTLVLRTDLSSNLSFRELLERVRLVALGAYAHQDLPFEKLLEELYPEQYLSRNPIFQVWFNLLNLEDERMELSGLTIETLSPPDVYSRFDLSLTAGEFNDRILLELAYNTDLFEGATIARMLGHLQNLLADLVTDPGKFISILSLLSETEKEDLQGDFNDNLEDEV
jgi:aspartate racemase